MTTNVPEIFYNSSLNWDLSSWLRNVYFCLGTNNKTFVHGSMTIIEITVSVMPLQNIMSFKTSLWITEIVNFTWRMWWLDIPFPEIRHAFLVFSLVRVPAACQLPLWKRSYIWKEVSKPQIVIVFPAKKKKIQSSAEALTAVPCHGEKSSTRKQSSIYHYHVYALVVCILWLSFKHVCITLNNFSEWQ